MMKVMTNVTQVTNSGLGQLLSLVPTPAANAPGVKRDPSLVRYVLKDPLDHSVVYEGEDSWEYIELLRHYPVVEAYEDPRERVTQVYREGRVPYLEILG